MPMFRIVLFKAVICLILAIMPLEACSPTPPIILGFAADLTSKQSDPSINLRNGVQMAVEEINASGGIKGRQINLLVEDDLGTHEGARAAENKLIDSGVVAVIGHYTSDQTLAGFEVTGTRGVLMLSATASTSVLSGKKDLFFRTVASTESLGQGFARYICQSLGISTIAIIYDRDNKSYAVPMMEAFKDRYTRFGCQINNLVEFSGASSPDFSPLVDGMKSSKPDGVFIIASPADTAVIAQTISLKNWEIKKFASSMAQSNILIQNGGKTVEGMEIIIAFDVNDTSPTLQEFKSNFLKRFAVSPIFSAMEGYETMRMLAAALQKTNGESKGLPDAVKYHYFMKLEA